VELILEIIVEERRGRRRRRRMAVLGCGALKFSWKYVLKYEVSFGKYKFRKKMARNMRAFFFANSSHFTVEHHILFFSFFFFKQWDTDWPHRVLMTISSLG
jgi:hypothetical protein